MKATPAQSPPGGQAARAAHQSDEPSTWTEPRQTGPGDNATSSRTPGGAGHAAVGPAPDTMPCIGPAPDHAAVGRLTRGVCDLGALGLVLNAVVLWNTRYTDAALGQLRATGDVDGADAARLSPLADKHINMLGRYAFASPAGRTLRPLHDPSSPGND